MERLTGCSFYVQHQLLLLFCVRFCFLWLCNTLWLTSLHRFSRITVNYFQIAKTPGLVHYWLKFLFFCSLNSNGVWRDYCVLPKALLQKAASSPTWELVDAIFHAGGQVLFPERPLLAGRTSAHTLIFPVRRIPHVSLRLTPRHPTATRLGGVSFV